MLGSERDADTRMHIQGKTIDHERGLDGLGDRIRNIRCRLRHAGSRDDDPELVGAQARNHVSVSESLLQADAELAQQFVAVAVTQRIIDLFEAVDVDAQKHQLKRRLFGAEKLLQTLGQPRAIRHPGERIVLGQIF